VSPSPPLEATPPIDPKNRIRRPFSFLGHAVAAFPVSAAPFPPRSIHSSSERPRDDGPGPTRERAASPTALCDDGVAAPDREHSLLNSDGQSSFPHH